ncbi:MAG: ImmA/IrrE family metallo-endopeptidase [Acutalibacteraceae bacterium]|nr:ImmA/IrrE family metallo-endopeptidase [Acutalibacteraceae bacterium]
METNKLYSIAESRGITIDFLPLCENNAISVELEGKGFIALDKRLVGRNAAERVALAHELGHLATGALYSVNAETETVRRQELSAHRWAIRHLVPYCELLSALKSGVESLSDLAERFCVTEEFMEKTIKFYSETKSA